MLTRTLQVLMTIATYHLWASTNAQNPQHLARTFIAGRYVAIDVADSIVCCANQFGLAIFNIATPSDLELLCSHPTKNLARGVAATSDYAYVADWHDGLRVVDISSPSAPQDVAVIPVSGYAAWCVSLSENFAFVGSYMGGLDIIDITTPSNPTVVGYYGFGYCPNVAVNGNYAYAVDWVGALRVIDISTPSNPQEIGYYSISSVHGIAATSDHVYLACDDGLHKIDISDPTNPVQVDYCNTTSAYDVGLYANHAYVATSAGMTVIDISGDMYITGSYNSPGQSKGIVLSGDYACIANFDNGLRIIDISTPSNPIEVDSYEPPGFPWCVAAEQNFVYVGARESGIYDDSPAEAGIHIFDVSDPQAPQCIGFCSLEGDPYGVALSGNYVYTANSGFLTGSGLHVIDVSDPSFPLEVGYFEIIGDVLDVKVAGNCAYVISGSSLCVFDISQPSNPNQIGICNLTNGSACGIAIQDNYVYVAVCSGFDGGLQIVDVTTPSNPIEVAYFGIESGVSDVDVEGNHAYVTAYFGDGLFIIDVSNPNNPVQVGSFQSQYALGVTVCGDYCYIGDEGRIYILDISTPSNPIEVGYYDTPGVGYYIAVVEPLIYMADVYSLEILRNTLIAIDEHNLSSPYHTPYQSYPSPFRSYCYITYKLTEQSKMRITIYDVTGRLVKVVYDRLTKKGNHGIYWDGRDSHGMAVPAGTYFCHLKTNDSFTVHKLQLIR